MTPDAAAQFRLFLGLWPTPGTRSALEAHAVQWHWPPSARRTHPLRLHVTLHFLGSVAAERLPALREGLSVSWEPFALLFDAAQVWPGGIAVLEARAVPAGLGRLHQKLAASLQGVGLTPESRPYRPHVTLARKATGARPPPGCPPLLWESAPGYALVRSLPGGRGYEPLQLFD